jgi:hypothetical protein
MKSRGVRGLCLVFCCCLRRGYEARRLEPEDYLPGCRHHLELGQPYTVTWETDDALVNITGGAGRIYL